MSIGCLLAAKRRAPPLGFCLASLLLLSCFSLTTFAASLELSG